VVTDSLFKHDPFIFPIEGDRKVLEQAEAEHRAVELVVVVFDVAQF
jgi:hypothetical protein